MNDLLLLPQPRRVERQSYTHAVQANRVIWIDSAAPQQLRFAAQRFKQALFDRLHLTWPIVTGATATDQMGLALRLAPDRITRPQGYELSIEPAQMTIAAHDETGVFYGVCTLIQLLETASDLVLPGMHIIDWPISVRGVMLDISRDKVPSLDTTKDLIDRLAGWKINQFQLYTEHTFAYRRHPDVWTQSLAVYGRGNPELDAYCRERCIELVPNQNSFGHMHRWFELPQYAPLAEAPNGFDYPWGEHSDGPFSLCPIDPGSLALVSDLFDELLPHFTSKMFNGAATRLSIWGRAAVAPSAIGWARAACISIICVKFTKRYRRAITLCSSGATSSCSIPS
jgi:hypothetical protein